MDHLNFLSGGAAVPFSSDLDDFAGPSINLKGKFPGDVGLARKALAAQAENDGFP